MTSVSFVYLREGSSDDGLVPHLRTLLMRSGLDEVVGTVNTAKGSVEDKLRAARTSGVEADLYVVHRDADDRSPAARRHEIAEAAGVVGLAGCHVGVVPVQALEAWLLLDEAEIRRVVGRPSGREPLALPPPSAVERQRDPKALLQQALLDASGATGRRRKDEHARFPQRRRTLLERLDLDGPIRTVASWKQLVADIDDFVRRTAR